MEDNEYRPVKHYSVAIYIVLVSIIYFLYKFNDKFHIVKNTAYNVTMDDYVNVTSATIEDANSRLTKTSNTDVTRAYMKNVNNRDLLVVVTETNEFEIDIYTMKSYDLDLGIPLKDESDYPDISVSSVTKLATGGLIVETVQTLGTNTFANKIYIKDDKIIDKGFEIRTDIVDKTLYYDNAILIIDTLNEREKDVIRVYDDTTGTQVFSMNSKDAPLLDTPEFDLVCSAVGNNFVTLSDLYTDKGGEYFIDFLDSSKEIKSVWDYIDVTDEQLNKFKVYEKATGGECLVFLRRTLDNGLMYYIDYPVKFDINNKDKDSDNTFIIPLTGAVTSN